MTFSARLCVHFMLSINDRQSFIGASMNGIVLYTTYTIHDYYCCCCFYFHLHKTIVNVPWARFAHTAHVIDRIFLYSWSFLEQKLLFANCIVTVFFYVKTHTHTLELHSWFGKTTRIDAHKYNKFIFAVNV